QLTVDAKPFNLMQAGSEDGKQRNGYRPLDAGQLSVGSDTNRLFGDELLPAKTETVQLLFERSPDALTPVPAILHSIAETDRTVFNGVSHLAGGRGAQGRNLAIP